MKRVFFIAILLCTGCKNRSNIETTIDHNGNIDIANQFIDAFYSFDVESLKLALSHAEKSQPSILYYQKWAECGNYKVLERLKCEKKNDSVVVCPVTVKDDLMSALQLDLNVTDTFRIFIKERKIRTVETSSNDPNIYYKAKDWIIKNRPKLIEKPCEDAWNGGSTPCECIKATVQGLTEFTAVQAAQKIE